MNRPPREFKRVPADQLQAFGQACMEAAGMPTAHAAQLAELLTNSSLRGVNSHGIRAIGGYSRAVRRGHVNPRPAIKVLKETDTAVLIDGDGGLGYAPMMEATERVIAKAQEKGMAAGAACHIGHYGSAGHYVRRAMEAGCIGFSVQGRHPMYYDDNKGKPAAYLGNPPLCFGLPSQEGAPIVLDGATCIMADYQRGEEFDALQEQIPAAFFKSMGYSAVGTVLGGAFVGQNNERAKKIQQQWPGARLGGMIFALRADLFAPLAELLGGVDDMVRGVAAMEPVRGHGESMLPGGMEHRLEGEYGRQGVAVDLDALKGLEETGREFGVPAPWADAAG